MIKYFSPSSFLCYSRSPETFYQRYIAPDRKRDPPIPAMSVGTAFDCIVKAAFWRDLGYEDEAVVAEKDLGGIFKEHQDFALDAGHYILHQYRKYGAYDELMEVLGESPIKPLMEKGTHGMIRGVPLYGIVDMFFLTKEHVPVILDFKVNGYCSNYPKSPTKGWSVLYCGDKVVRSGYKKAELQWINGMPMNRVGSMEEDGYDWAVQLTFYRWLFHEWCQDEVPMYCIDQCVCKPQEPRPILRFARHIRQINPLWQNKLATEVQERWESFNKGHFMLNRTLEESKARCLILDRTEPEEEAMIVYDFEDPFHQACG